MSRKTLPLKSNEIWLKINQLHEVTSVASISGSKIQEKIYLCEFDIPCCSFPWRSLIILKKIEVHVFKSWAHTEATKKQRKTSELCKAFRCRKTVSGAHATPRAQTVKVSETTKEQRSNILTPSSAWIICWITAVQVIVTKSTESNTEELKTKEELEKNMVLLTPKLYIMIWWLGNILLKTLELQLDLRGY